MIDSNNPPAFPTDHIIGSGNGILLRDYFAAKALAGIMANNLDPSWGWTIDEMAMDAYTQADAMLAARKEGAK